MKRALDALRSWRDDLALPPAAKRERAADRQGPKHATIGVDQTIDLGAQWLGRAQDCSITRDGGVARHYSLIDGWASSYPETTGYIVPTLLDYARVSGDRSMIDRARRMLDWFVRIQLSGGPFQGGQIDALPVAPVTFNTGQILLGLAFAVREFDEYTETFRQAADWLVKTQDPDGCWRRFPTPFAMGGEKAYETHVSWGLFEAARVDDTRGYAEAALRNVRWALTKQRPNGWVADCCLNDPVRPLTHTLGYFLRGVVEAYLFSKDAQLLEAARRTADGLLAVLRPDGLLPGRWYDDWRPAVDWVCLTGTVQIAHSWLLLFRVTGDSRYRKAAILANAYVRRTISADGPPEIRGGVKGSFPVDGDYGRFQYLNWAAKFCVDSHLVEREIQSAHP